jgi:hypothetical protein
MSWSTPSSHRILGLSALLVPSGLVLNIFFYGSLIFHTHQVPCPCQYFDFNVVNNIWFFECFI